MSISSYRDLKVWQLGMELVIRVYRTTSSFPKEECFGITSQIRRAAVSIPSNLADGHSRDSTREFLRYIAIALGSLAELDTQLDLAMQLAYLSPAEHEKLRLTLDELGRMVRGLQKSPKSKSLVPNP